MNKQTIIDKKKKVGLDWIKENPKKVFFIMILLTIISIVSNIFSYNKIKNQPTVWEERFTYKDVKKSFQEDIEELKKNEYRAELKSYLFKETLSKQDSSRIEYLINKLQSDEEKE